MTRLRTTPLGVAIHPHDQSPVYGTQATQVMIDDEAGGPFIVLRQFNDYIKPGEIRLDMDELEAVVRAARRLMKAQPNGGAA